MKYTTYFIAADTYEPLLDSYIYITKDIEDDTAEEIVAEEYETDMYQLFDKRWDGRHKLPSLPKVFNPIKGSMVWKFGKENNQVSLKDEEGKYNEVMVERFDILYQAFEQGNFNTDCHTTKVIDGSPVFNLHNVHVGTLK